MISPVDTSMMSPKMAIPTIDKSLDLEALKDRTDQFESIIIKMLLDNSMKDEKNIFSDQKDPGDRIFKQMYREELSKVAAGGFGFSEMLFKHLSEK